MFCKHQPSQPIWGVKKFMIWIYSFVLYALPGLVLASDFDKGTPVRNHYGAIK